MRVLVCVGLMLLLGCQPKATQPVAQTKAAPAKSINIDLFVDDISDAEAGDAYTDAFVAEPSCRGLVMATWSDSKRASVDTRWVVMNSAKWWGILGHHGGLVGFHKTDEPRHQYSGETPKEVCDIMKGRTGRVHGGEVQ